MYQIPSPQDPLRISPCTLEDTICVVVSPDLTVSLKIIAVETDNGWLAEVLEARDTYYEETFRHRCPFTAMKAAACLFVVRNRDLYFHESELPQPN